MTALTHHHWWWQRLFAWFHGHGLHIDQTPEGLQFGRCDCGYWMCDCWDRRGVVVSYHHHIEREER